MTLPECIHRRSEYRGAVECASNRLLPVPPRGRTETRPASLCLVCPYAQRANLTDADLQPRPELTPADFPCIHRGNVIDRRECQLCGARGKLFDVHACAVRGACSVQTRERGLQACVACEDINSGS